MAQADSVNNTTAPVDPTRRRFLSKAAGVAAGSAVLTMGATIPTAGEASQRVPDPIFAAIEAHKVACAATVAAVDRHSELDRELPIEKCLSRVDAWGEKIVATDDPRWIDAERAVNSTFRSEDDAACALVNVRPTTPAGLIALLRYAVEADTDGERWPRDVESDDGTKTRSWEHFLIEAVADTLPNVLAAA
jgi:hypothetical protein